MKTWHHTHTREGETKRMRERSKRWVVRPLNRFDGGKSKIKLQINSNLNSSLPQSDILKGFLSPISKSRSDVLFSEKWNPWRYTTLNTKARRGMIVFSFFLSGQWQADGKWFTLFWGTSEIFPGPLLFANGISFYPFRGPGEMHCARIHCKYRRDFTFLSPPSISAFIMCIDATPGKIVLKSLIVWRLSLSQRLWLVFSPSSSSWTLLRLKCGEIRGFFLEGRGGQIECGLFQFRFVLPFAF